MYRVQRISDEEREKIPEEQRCAVSYNGYHQWEIIRPQVIGQMPYVICKKCLAKKEVEAPKKPQQEYSEF